MSQEFEYMKVYTDRVQNDLKQKIEDLEDKLHELEIILANQSGRDKVVGLIAGAIVVALLQTTVSLIFNPEQRILPSSPSATEKVDEHGP